MPGLFTFVPGFLLDHGRLIHAVELGVVGIGKEAVVCRKLAPGGLLDGWPGRWPSGRLQGGKARGQADVVEDLDEDVVSENEILACTSTVL